MLKAVIRHLRRVAWDHPAVLGFDLVRRYRRRFGRWPRLLPPRSFNEKLLFRMIFDRRPILPRLAGKLESRGYVTERLGRGAWQAELLAAVRNPGELRGLDLPASYIMKASHASGLLRIVTPEHPITFEEQARLVTSWVAVDYAQQNLEWCYKTLQRVVVIEELLRGEDGKVPRDYKFFCFDGNVHFIQIDSDRYEGHLQSLFDRAWNYLPVQVSDYAPHPTPPAPPPTLQDMIEVAERLSAGLDFLRVDLYELGSEIRVGELTNYPQGGWGVFRPTEWDEVFGRPWRLPSFRLLRGSSVSPRTGFSSPAAPEAEPATR